MEASARALKSLPNNPTPHGGSLPLITTSNRSPPWSLPTLP